LRAPRPRAGERERAERAAPEPSANAAPPAAPLPGVRAHVSPIRLCVELPHPRGGRRSLARRDATLRARVLGAPRGRDRRRGVVELRGARLGWLLGVG